MEYGQRHQSLHLPNVIIGIGADGEWINAYNRTQVDLQEPHRALVGLDAIAEYAESALEAFEKTGDVQAGLIAIQVLYRYEHAFGELPEALLWDMSLAVLHHDSPDSYLYLLAIEAHPTIAGALHQIMRLRAQHYDSIEAVFADRHLAAYLEATASRNDIRQAIEQLIDPQIAD